MEYYSYLKCTPTPRQLPLPPCRIGKRKASFAVCTREKKLNNCIIAVFVDIQKGNERSSWKSSASKERNHISILCWRKEIRPKTISCIARGVELRLKIKIEELMSRLRVCMWNQKPHTWKLIKEKKDGAEKEPAGLAAIDDD